MLKYILIKKLRFAFVAIALIGTTNLAAAQRGPTAPPVSNWTGFYVGGNFGYSLGNANTDMVGNASTVALPFFFGGFPANTAVAVAGSNTARPNGALVGGQVGYNYQINPRWLLGFEVDIQGSGERGISALSNPFSTTVCTGAFLFGNNPATCTVTGTLNGTAATTYDARIDWFGTVRGRVGGLITDQILLYGTGGLAYGHVQVSATTNVAGLVNTNNGSGLPSVVPLTPGTSAFRASGTQAGFAIGAGAEGKISYKPGWTWKLEYLYVDLGSLSGAGPFPGASSPFVAPQFLTSPFTGSLATHTHFTDNILRVALNYQFR